MEPPVIFKGTQVFYPWRFYPIGNCLLFDFQYMHKWEPGDFIISDNLAVGHEASPQTQYSKDKVGLRVMHRVTIAGKTIPKK